MGGRVSLGVGKLVTVDMDILKLFAQYSSLIMVHDSVEEREMVNMLRRLRSLTQGLQYFNSLV